MIQIIHHHDHCHDSIASDPVYCGTADVSDCFHRMLIDDYMSRYFCLDYDFKAWELGVSGMEIDGHVLERESSVFLGACALPMGFSWALFLAQRANENTMAQVPGVVTSNLFNDATRPCSLRHD
jgi:hypothetical protein